MALIFVQTDTAASQSWSTQCSSAADGDTSPLLKNDALVGGTAGSTPVDVGSTKSTATNAVYFTTGAVGATSWPGSAGNEITFRLNITTAGPNTNITKVTACRMNSSGVSQGVYGQWTGTTSLGTTGVKTFTLNTTAQSASASDWILFIVEQDNSSHSTETWAATPDQNIDTAIQSIVTGAAAFSGAATAASSGTVTTTHAAATALSGAAVVVAVGGVVLSGSASLSGVATTASTGTYLLEGAAAVGGAATTGATATATLGAAASLAGVASVSAVAGGITAELSAAAVVRARASVNGEVFGDGALSASSVGDFGHSARQLFGATPATADYYVEGRFGTQGATQNPGVAYGVMARAVDENNGYVALSHIVSLLNYGYLIVGKLVNGVFTELARSDAGAQGTLGADISTVRLTVSGETIRAQIRNGVVVEAYDATFTGPGKAGVYLRKSAQVSKFTELHDLWVYQRQLPAIKYGSAALTGVGSVVAGASASVSGAAAVAAAASLIAAGSTGTIHHAASSLSAAGSVSATSVMALAGAADAAGVATVAVAGSVTKQGAAALNGVGAVSAIGSEDLGAAASLSGVAALSATATNEQQAEASLSGTAAVTAVGYTAGTQLAQAALAGAADLVATGSLEHTASGQMSGAATLSASGATDLSASAALQGVATLDATPRAVRAAVVLQAGAATLTAAAVVDHDASSVVVAAATLNAQPSADWAANAVVYSNATVAGVEADLVAYDTFTESSQTLLSDHVGEYGSWGVSSGNLALKIDANGKLRVDL